MFGKCGDAPRARILNGARIGSRHHVEDEAVARRVASSGAHIGQSQQDVADALPIPDLLLYDGEIFLRAGLDLPAVASSIRVSLDGGESSRSGSGDRSATP